MIRRLGTYLALMVLTAWSMSVALADTYPSKPIKMVVGYVPGGGADSVGRLFAYKLADILGQQVVVDNKPGANGVIAAESVKNSLPDGYTIHMVTSSHGINPVAYAKLPYDTLKDFATISEVGDAALVMVVPPALPVSSVKEFIALAKSRTEGLQYASAGMGNITQLGAELMNSLAGIKMSHVPYKGSSPAIVDLIAGRVAVYFPPLPSGLPFITSGKLKALAVSSTKRSTLAPNLPTIAEAALPGYEVTAWYGLVAPAGTPPEIVNMLRGAVVKSLQSPDLLGRMKAEGLDPVGGTPDEFHARVKNDIDKWRRLFHEANIKIE